MTMFNRCCVVAFLTFFKSQLFFFCNKPFEKIAQSRFSFSIYFLTRTLETGAIDQVREILQQKN